MSALLGFAIAGGIIILIIMVSIFVPHINCSDTSLYYEGEVEFIFDGDTIQVEGCKVRLPLVDTPEKNEPGYDDATIFTANLCPKGSTVIVDQDDLQPHDKYGRVLGKVICSSKDLSEELVKNDHAEIIKQYCATSEFAKEPWTGCK